MTVKQSCRSVAMATGRGGAGGARRRPLECHSEQYYSRGLVTMGGRGRGTHKYSLLDVQDSKRRRETKREKKIKTIKNDKGKVVEDNRTWEVVLLQCNVGSRRRSAATAEPLQVSSEFYTF